MKLNEPTVLKLREHVVNCAKKVPEISVMITGDWHISPIVSSRQADFLREAIEVTKPDVIILQGDIVDSPTELKRETSLEKLRTELLICSDAAPTMLVLGAHDYITPTTPAKVMKDFSLDIWEKNCKKCNVKLLMNEKFEPIPGVVFYGMFQDESMVLGLDRHGRRKHHSNPDVFLRKLKKIDFKCDESKINWFITHAPMISKEIVAELAGFDIASFGHTHGGIVPRGMDEAFEKFGINFGLISPERRLFPGLVRGVKPVGDSTLLLIDPGMTGAQFCAPKFAQNLNFVKAAEVSVVKLKNQ